MNALNPVRRVRDQIAEPIEQRLGAVASAKARARAGELLDLVGIPKKRGGAYPHELSGGMRQRAMIAMALACDPAIVIGDEPTTALDVMVQAQILELLERLRRELGLSLILITHDLSVIAETCDRVLIMYAGRVAEEGPVGQVFRRAAPSVHPEAAVGAFPNIHADRRTLEVIPGPPPDLRDAAAGLPVRTALRVRDAGLHGGRAARGHVRRRRPRRLPPLSAGGDGRRAGDGRRRRTPSDRPAVVERRRPPPDGSRGRLMADDLLRLDGPEGPFPDPGRARRHAPAAGPAASSGRSTGSTSTIQRGEVLGARRRIRLRQDDDRPGHRQADPADGRDDRRSTARTSAACGARGALRDYRRRVQLIFQDPYETLNPKQTIHDFVAEPLEVNGIGTSAAEREERVARGARGGRPAPGRDFAFRYPHELSGGQRQRVVIAGALVMDPELIVADEPVSMLDVSIRTELLRLMLDLRAERGLTYLFITHDLSLAWVIADRIAVMYLGKIMEIGPAERVIRDAAATRTRQALVSRLAVAGSAGGRASGRSARSSSARRPMQPTSRRGCRFHPRCPLVFDRCRVEEPPLFDVGGGQPAACWLVEGGRALPVMPASGRVPAAVPGGGVA